MRHIEIYRQLKKTNCGYCQERTCMAFALAVARGERPAGDCPYLPDDALHEFSDSRSKGHDWRDELRKRMAPLRQEVASLDLSSRAEGIGATLVPGGLSIPVLGKEFRVLADGRVESDAHVNPWVLVPLLRYVLKGGSGLPAGDWVSFGELSVGPIRGQYFTRRCEEPLRRIVENHGGLYSELMTMFCASTPENSAADKAWLLNPLPRVQFLIQYWGPEEDIESRLRLLVGRNVEQFLDAESVGILARGFVEMLERMSSTHDSSTSRTKNSRLA